jgi:hypothetical protein
VIFDILHIAVPLVCLLCFIYVVVKMFQNNNVWLGIACLVGVLICGFGPLLAFIVGWVKSGAWQIRGLMLVWTVAIIAYIVLYMVQPPSWSADFQQQIQDLQKQVQQK